MQNILMILTTTKVHLSGIPFNLNERKMVMSDFIQNLSKDFFIFQIEEIKNKTPFDKNLLEVCFYILIEFMIRTETLFFLFDTIKKIIEDNGFFQIFMDCLNPFLVQRKI